jgi:predicted nucleic acid-binding protein
MTLCDAGPLVALADRKDRGHAACVAFTKRAGTGPLVTTWPCFTEAMYLGFRRAGFPAQAAFWRLRESGRLVLHDPTADEVDRMSDLMVTYRDLPMDLADASLCAAAERLGLRRIFTLDRHFYAYRLADGSAMTVVP